MGRGIACIKTSLKVAWRGGVTALTLLLCPLGAQANTPASTPDCEAIAAQTAARYGLPAGMMPAISRVETGLKQGEKGVRAWPWTLNVQGKGYYFKTRAEALTKLRAVIKSGVRNVDVGCMQINYRWHGEHFSSIEEMMEPGANTAYAATFLTRLRRRLGSWEEAVAHYHSADEARGTAYLGRVNRVIQKLPQDQPSFVASTAEGVPQATQATQGYKSAKVKRPVGVLALAAQPLVAVADSGQGTRHGNVVLPPSPLPDLSAAMPTHKRLKRQRNRSPLSTSRQDLVAQLRAEFANSN